MRAFLQDKRILVGITGSIAAYKSADLVRRLREWGAVVRVAMSEHAKRFITPLTMQAVSGHPVHDELFDLQAEAAMGHIELARWADVIIVAPATADFMARLAHGQANDLLTTLCLATSAPIMIAPAMNQAMWKHPLTQENRSRLETQGVHVLETSEGSQACGDVGPGRMLEPLAIREKINTLFAPGELAGVKILVTAGPTHEAIDPVRFIANGSSGKMGYALCEAAQAAGASVTLISGPVALSAPNKIDVIRVTTADEMNAEVMRKVSDYDIFLAVAAVADYKAQTIATEKIHKHEESLQLTLVRNPDIVANVGQLARKPFIVGFAAETAAVIKAAKAKRQGKQMDMIIANDVANGKGIGADDNEVTVITADSEMTLPKANKKQLARELIAIIADKFSKRTA